MPLRFRLQRKTHRNLERIRWRGNWNWRSGRSTPGSIPLAEADLEALKNSTNLSDKITAGLLRAKALCQQNQEAQALSEVEALMALQPSNPPPDVVFWAAHCRLKLGTPRTAIDLIDNLKPPPAADHLFAIPLQRLHLRGLVALGDTNGLMTAYRQFSVRPASARPLDLRLDWSRLLHQQGQSNEAVAVLGDLAPFTSAPSLIPSLLWRAQLLTSQQKFKAAQADIGFLLSQSALLPAQRRQILMLQAQLNLGQKKYIEAAMAVLQAENVQGPETPQPELRLARAKLLILGGDTNGVKLLQEQIRLLDQPEQGAEAMLFLGDHQLDSEQPAEALKTFDLLLETFPGSTPRDTALLGRAWSLKALERFGEAATAFEKAAANLADIPRRREAEYAAADSWFAHGQIEKARSGYQEFCRAYPGDPLLPQALFQAALCRVELGEPEEAERELLRLSVIYQGDSEFAEKAYFQVARLMLDRKATDQAARQYEAYLENYPKGAHVDDARLNLGLVHYRNNRFTEAQREFERVVAEASDVELAEQAAYMRAWTIYLGGRAGATYSDARAEAEARAAFLAFTRSYPESRWNEDVYFWIAEQDFDKGEFKAAEHQFQELMARYPDGRLADKALYWAGRAAVEQKELRRAIEHFNRLVELFPRSPKVPSALLAEGDALSFLGEFEAAILVYERIPKEHADSYLAAPAWGRIGDSHYALEPPAFEAAETAYRKILDGKSPLDLKIQADYKLGLIRQKQKNEEAAREHYLKLFYTYQAKPAELSTEALVWVEQAGLAAADLLQQEKDYRKALHIYRRVRGLGGRFVEKAEQAIDDLRKNRLILF